MVHRDGWGYSESAASTAGKQPVDTYGVDGEVQAGPVVAPSVVDQGAYGRQPVPVGIVVPYDKGDSIVRFLTTGLLIYIGIMGLSMLAFAASLVSDSAFSPVAPIGVAIMGFTALATVLYVLVMRVKDRMAFSQMLGKSRIDGVVVTESGPISALVVGDKITPRMYRVNRHWFSVVPALVFCLIGGFALFGYGVSLSDFDGAVMFGPIELYNSSPAANV